MSDLSGDSARQQIEQIKGESSPVLGTAVVAALGGFGGIVFKTNFTPEMTAVMETNQHTEVDQTAGWDILKDFSDGKGEIILVLDVQWVYPAARLQLWVPVEEFKVELGVFVSERIICIAPPGKFVPNNMIAMADVPHEEIAALLRVMETL